jgi:hypothetical protein
MPDMDGIPEIEVGAQRREIVGVVVHVVTATGLRGPAVPTAIVRDDAIALVEEEQHLDIPIVSRKRPAMAEDDRFARTPVLVEDLRPVARRDRRHALPPVSAQLLHVRASSPRGVEAQAVVLIAR